MTDLQTAPQTGMTQPHSPPWRQWLRRLTAITGRWDRFLRLASGIILFAFVTTHLSNHALGLISLDVMEDLRLDILYVWQVGIGFWLLFASAVIHPLLGLYSLWSRHRLMMKPLQALQVILGLTIPLVFIDHLVETRLAFEYARALPTYQSVMLDLYRNPLEVAVQAALLLIIWTHGCIGLYFWLRFKSWYRPLAGAGRLVALLLPVLALIAFFQIGHEVMERAADPAWVAAEQKRARVPAKPEAAEKLRRIEQGLYITYGALLVLVLAAREGRRLWQRRHGVVRVQYPGAKVVASPRGPSVLDISRGAGLPHASVCGGRGRCSTCRVRVGAGGQGLPPPSAEEAAVLARIGAPPGVRLACQIRPHADVSVTPLLPASAGADKGLPTADYHHGREMEIAVMFTDLRGFTSLAEHMLPYDTVFLLNRYFAEMGKVIEAEGGHLDKFLGDGIMALFGLENGPEAGAKAALTAARAMIARLDLLNRELADDLEQPLKVGIGIHLGTAIVGDMGYGAATQLTAIGDVVNTASRLESMTKELGVPLVISADLAALAGLSTGEGKRHTLAIRGRQQALDVVALT